MGAVGAEKAGDRWKLPCSEQERIDLGMYLIYNLERTSGVQCEVLT